MIYFVKALESWKFNEKGLMAFTKSADVIRVMTSLQFFSHILVDVELVYNATKFGCMSINILDFMEDGPL